MVMEARANADDFVRSLKASLAAAHPHNFPTLFPEWFKSKKTAEEIDAKATQADGTRDIDAIDDSEVDWATPGTEFENAELESFIAQALASSHTVSATDLEEGGWV